MASRPPRRGAGPALRQAWDRRAWADARPDKVVPISGADLHDRWVEELLDLGFRAPKQRRARPASVPIGSLDRDALAKRAVDRLGARHSAWSAADVRGEVEKLIASCDVVAPGAVRRELAEDLTARAVAACVPLVNGDDAPEHVHALSSLHPDRWRLDQLLAWEEKRIALAEAALEALVRADRELPTVTDLLPSPSDGGRRKSETRTVLSGRHGSNPWTSAGPKLLCCT